MSQISFFSSTKYIKSVATFILCLIAFNLSSSIVLADNLASPSFKMQMSTINITGGEKTGGGYKLNDTVGQTAQGQFDAAGYRVRAGFQYVRSRIPFSFHLDSFTVDLGTLIPNTFTTATNTLTVSAGGAYGYQVRVLENQPLTKYSSGSTIPDTACDSATTCALIDANIWLDTARYGFGYNMSGNDVDTADFVNGTYFRPFPNAANGDTPSVVMSKAGVTAQSIATLTYKINISPIQADGSYENLIQYIAIPAY